MCSLNGPTSSPTTMRATPWAPSTASSTEQSCRPTFAYGRRPRLRGVPHIASERAPTGEIPLRPLTTMREQRPSDPRCSTPDRMTFRVLAFGRFFPNPLVPGQIVILVQIVEILVPIGVVVMVRPAVLV